MRCFAYSAGIRMILLAQARGEDRISHLGTLRGDPRFNAPRKTGGK